MRRASSSRAAATFGRKLALISARRRVWSGGSQVESNRSEKNGDFEYVIAAGNTDLGNNRSNGATFAFPPAGGSYE